MHDEIAEMELYALVGKDGHGSGIKQGATRCHGLDRRGMLDRLQWQALLCGQMIRRVTFPAVDEFLTIEPRGTPHAPRLI